MIPRPICIPVDNNDVPRRRLIVPALPVMMCLGPVHDIRHPGELRYSPGFDIPTLICALADEASAPADPVVISIPAPELLSAVVADLFGGHLHDGSVTYTDVVAAISESLLLTQRPISYINRPVM